MFQDKTILLTGGTGSFGKKFIRMTLQKYKPRKLIVFSRDELKQFSMMEKISPQKYPIRYFLGDVRDADRLKRAMRGVDYVIHAAAYKHVPAAEYNPFEFVKTNILGAENVIEAALDAGVKKVVALSTDKACNPANLYGATKLASDKIFVAANAYSGGQGCTFSVVRYGNVVGSRGSVIPFFMNQAKKGVIPITHPEMTRFWISLEEAVKMVTYSIEKSIGGEIYIPKIPTMNIMDLAEAVAPGVRKEVIGIRPGEKLHEVMVSEDDSRNTYDFGKYYAILPHREGEVGPPKAAGNNPRVPENFRYSSDTNPERIGVKEMVALLKDYIQNKHELITQSDIDFYGDL